MDKSQTVTCEINAFGTPIAFHLPNPEDHIQKHILRNRSLYEQSMLEEAGPLVPDNALIIDAGANIGNHTLFFAKVLGAKVLAFEPNPTTVALLQTNVEINRLHTQIEIHPVALGASDGTGVISDQRADNVGMAQVVHSQEGDIVIRSLDDVVGNRPVHLIKIDVEGMECEVLKGALKILERSKPALFVEAATVEELNNIEEILRPFGYRKIKVYNHTPTYLFKAAFPARDTSPALRHISPALLASLPPTTGIHAGMASVAGNEVALRAAIMSLLPQVDRLFLYLNGFSKAPEFCENNPKITYFIDEDGTKYGDAGKFWGLEQVKDAIYVTCDDDIIYPPDFVQHMVSELAQTGGRSVQAVHGSLILQPAVEYNANASRSVFHFQNPLIRRRLAHVAGTGTCVFHSSVVQIKLSDFRAPNMADIWLAEYLVKNGIPSYVVPRPRNWLIPLEVKRQTIYEQSRQGSGNRYDSSKRQDEVLSTMYPVSILNTQPFTTSFILDVDPSIDVSTVLTNINLGERDPVVFVVCDKVDDTVRNAIISTGFRCELHLLSRNSHLDTSYRELLKSAIGNIKAWKIDSSFKAERVAIDGIENWISNTFPATSPNA